ncbi:hypothetical protein [Pseudoalteromonas sp. S554]|uniref:hypothetical protein n=1 Tax=Pseudoalteromonas sp. S554 TaxID=2066516 RepID=UPI00110C9CD2|nr:hypothetical protein [Pseudoalteromonas sp. S554]TMS80555.1 hypothetical protein CWB65_14650 [Pseudoalteromonas sp. S554]
MFDLYSVLANGITITGNKVTVEHQCTEELWGSIKRCFQAYRAKWVGYSYDFFMKLDCSAFMFFKTMKSDISSTFVQISMLALATNKL